MNIGFVIKWEFRKCTFNPLVAGSNPARPTKYRRHLVFQVPVFFLHCTFDAELKKQSRII